MVFHHQNLCWITGLGSSFFPHCASLCLRPTNSYVKEASRSHTHSRGPEGDGGGGHRRAREPSPEEEPSYMEEEEERGYHTNYSPSPPQQEQYSPPQRRGYHSDEYESPEPEPSPPPPRKEVRHVKPNKEPSKNHHHSDKNRDRDEERRQRNTQTSSNRGGGEGSEGKKCSADRERHQSPVQKPSKHSKKSSVHESKREEKKRGGDEGECVCVWRPDVLMFIIISFLPDLEWELDSFLVCQSLMLPLPMMQDTNLPLIQLCCVACCSSEPEVELSCELRSSDQINCWSHHFVTFHAHKA